MINQPDPSLESAQEVRGPAATIENRHPADFADHLEGLPLELRVAALASQSPDHAAESITEMGTHDQMELIEQLDPRFTAGILEYMAPDDAVDILARLGDEKRSQVLRHIHVDDARVLSNLMRFDPESAGGAMNTEILVINQNNTVDEAIQLIRKNVEEIEVPYYVYLVDDNRHFMGVISMRELLVGRPGQKLKEFIHDQNLIYVTFDVDREVVARLISRYNFLALPVVDYEQRVLGVVTVDDVIDIIHEEASEDLQSMVGAGPDETVDSPWTYSLGKRLPWLLINLLNSCLSAFVVHLFEGSITQMAILAVLMPVVANQAGNTGQQALAVIIRQLALERFERRKMWAAVLREARIGAANGFIVGVVAFLGVILLTQKADLAAVMALALSADMVLGAVAGACIPLVLRLLGRDPAQASSIFLTALTDSAGFFIFLSLSVLVLL